MTEIWGSLGGRIEGKKIMAKNRTKQRPNPVVRPNNTRNDHHVVLQSRALMALRVIDHMTAKDPANRGSAKGPSKGRVKRRLRVIQNGREKLGGFLQGLRDAKDSLVGTLGFKFFEVEVMTNDDMLKGLLEVLRLIESPKNKISPFTIAYWQLKPFMESEDGPLRFYRLKCGFKVIGRTDHDPDPKGHGTAVPICNAALSDIYTLICYENPLASKDAFDDEKEYVKRRSKDPDNRKRKQSGPPGMFMADLARTYRSLWTLVKEEAEKNPHVRFDEGGLPGEEGRPQKFVTARCMCETILATIYAMSTPTRSCEVNDDLSEAFMLAKIAQGTTTTVVPVIHAMAVQMCLDAYSRR